LIRSAIKGLAPSKRAAPAWVLVFLLLLLCPHLPSQGSADTAIVSLNPQSSRVWGIGAAFAVDVVVSNVTNLYGWQFTLYYDSSLLNGTSITEGSFLKGAGDTYFVSGLNDSYNAIYGIVTAACSLLGNVSGVSGSGTLATIAFQTKASGNCLLIFSGTKLGDPQGTAITHYVFNGAVEVVPPVHDVAVQGVTPSKNEVATGRSLEVDVVVANQGNTSEDFTVNLYANSSIVATEPVRNLTAGALATVVLYWNTTSTAVGDSYEIKAEAVAVLEDINLDNNVVTDGFVKITQAKHDVAVKSVTPQYTMIYEGQKVNITAVVANRGDYYETFDVTAYRDDAAIDTQHVVNLEYGKEQTLSFSWDTTGVASNESYAIKVTAGPVLGEANVQDNTLVDGSIVVLPRVMLSINTVGVVPSDQYGHSVSNFTRGSMAYFKVTINCTSIIPAFLLLTVNVYDANNVAFGVMSFRGLVAPGLTAFVLGSIIPKTSNIGKAAVYVNLLTDWPHLGGTPYCPECSAQFQIGGP
jgi:hypothetical protein